VFQWSLFVAVVSLFVAAVKLSNDKALREIVERLMRIGSPTCGDVDRVKLRVAAKYRLGCIPSNAEIISMLKSEEKRKLLPLLRRKVARVISGVSVVAVMTEPYPCPQSKPCAYCPGGPSFGVPQSYTGFEPASMRGLQSGFDPFLQVRGRIEQLGAIGHCVDKVELIVMGGTFPAMPRDYQVWFVRRCLDAVTGKESCSLDEAKSNAEGSRVRNVGITVETRPDWAKEAHVDGMLGLGVTRVELGVQNPCDEVYRLVGRGHSVGDVVEATRVLKDAGLKVVYHMMPGLPGSDFGRDLEAFKRIFGDADFRPDMVKIYPCLVLRGTRAFEWFCEGKYVPYTTEEAAELIVEVKKIVPSWVRIMRVQRDIPAPLIVAGVVRSNLRQLVNQKLRERGERCKCIRCREVGHRLLVDGVEPNPDKVEVLTAKYAASGGEEVFISAEDVESDVLVGYLRLRIPSEEAHRPEITREACSVVRELHVYGPLVPVGKRLAGAWQHRGFGGVLLGEAERLSRDEYGLGRILVISALGTREYYMRFGYERDGAYMSKKLSSV